MLKPIIISPPFGNYIVRPYATNVCGSWTANRRPGLPGRVARSLRPTRRGWVNRIGLRNQGIKSVQFKPDRLYSVAALDLDDWDVFLDTIPDGTMVELNLGCPNTPNKRCGPFEYFVEKYSVVSAKLPHVEEARAILDRCHRQGIRLFHISNTMPTERGGLSGKELKKNNLHAIQAAKRLYPDIEIIAGGGIYSPKDVRDYAKAGADYFSLSTIWFTPWRVPAVVRAIEEVAASRGIRDDAGQQGTKRKAIQQD